MAEDSSVSLVCKCHCLHLPACMQLFEMFVFLFSSLAEVNTLSSDDGPLRWVPVIESVIPIVIHKKKVIAMLNLTLHLVFESTNIITVTNNR